MKLVWVIELGFTLLLASLQQLIGGELKLHETVTMDTDPHHRLHNFLSIFTFTLKQEVETTQNGIKSQ